MGPNGRFRSIMDMPLKGIKDSSKFLRKNYYKRITLISPTLSSGFLLEMKNLPMLFYHHPMGTCQTLQSPKL
jgi:hypothetical protein